MPKKKLKLETLEVDSFATKLSDEEKVHLNGGTTNVCVLSIVHSIVVSIKVSVVLSIKTTPILTYHNEGVCPPPPNQTKNGNLSCPGGAAC